MKKKQKVLGVFCLVTILALVAGTIMITTSEPLEDVPIGYSPGGAGPVEDVPIGYSPGGAGPVEDVPIGTHGYATG